ncbi:diacylglycerol/polyprenol kinase family protein [Tahibacter amnicola]|uniref:Dolichol kinase n=1 Tax=Tahibacter amnicola TaxID=2976241 RepID=A0ABY6B9H5_9GAMM|nr:hypothetical protein [Tahibacter amnicola]UXI66202.1 hypothetical protein N4264_15745 [Tahibacter amnicola]
MAFSRVLWLSFRRHVRTHAIGLAISVMALALSLWIPVRFPAWRGTALVVSASALLYFAYVLSALGGTLYGVSVELRRKSVHLLGGLSVIGVFVATQSPWPVVALCGVLLGWMVYTRRSTRLRLLRQLSVDRRDGSRSSGDVLFPICVAATAVFAGTPSPAWLCGTTILVFSDTVAALVGVHYGRWRFRSFGGGKSLEGSAAFFASAFLIALLFGAGQTPGSGTLLAYVTALTAVEAISSRGTDNLTIPVVSLLVLGGYSTAITSAVLFGSAGALTLALAVHNGLPRLRAARSNA